MDPQVLPAHRQDVHTGVRWRRGVLTLARTSSAAIAAAGWEQIGPPYSTLLARTISAIAVHPANPDRIYVGYAVAGAHTVWRGDRQADGTFQWTDVSGLYASTSLPSFPVSALVLDPDHPRRMFAATQVGIFVTEDEGDWWRPFNDGLPNGSIVGMRFRERSRTLYAAPYGRGIFQRGDLIRRVQSAAPTLKVSFSEITREGI